MSSSYLEQIRASLPKKVSDMTSDQLQDVFQIHRKYFSDYQLTDQRLDQKDIRDVLFLYVPGQRVSFRGATLTDCQVLGCDWSEADCSQAALKSFRIQSYEGHSSKLSGALFVAAHMQRASLSTTNFEKASFSRANLTNAYIHDCDFQGADFTGAIMAGSEFVVQNIDLRGADLTSAQLEPSVFLDVVYDQYTKWPVGFNPRNEFSYTCIYKPS